MGTLRKQVALRWTLVVGTIVCILAFIIGLGIGLWVGRGAEHQEGAESAEVAQEYATIRQKLIDNIKPESILDTLRFMSSEPHLAGSPRDNELADWVKGQWEESGLDHVTKSAYQVLLSFPNKANPNKVSLLDAEGAVVFETAGFEKKLSPDQNHSEVVPPFNAFAPAGDVQGDLVYVNYGRAADFEQLKTLGVSCSGKIVIARYGKIYRGNKLYEAQKHGALGLILFSDPSVVANSGVTEVFPKTWWMPGTGIERGSAALVKGDQLTQGYPAKDYAYRIPMADYKAHVQLQIPCQPIGYDEAWQFLSLMGGPAAPADWQGGLNITYHLGPGFDGARSTHTVRLQVHNTEELRTIYNVMGRIEGREEPDRYVLLGSHRDAWMFGAVDALSSQAGLVEVAKAFGKLRKEGWRPRRTIMFLSWTAEEYGMVSSSEWVEEHWKTLYDRAVAYLNGDTTLTGNFTLKAALSPVLQDVFINTTKEIRDPEQRDRMLYDTWRERNPEVANSSGSGPRVVTPGSGTDYAHFIYFAGVPITYHKFISDPKLGMNGYPLYHTVYETFQLIRLVDPAGRVMTTAAEVWAALALRLSDSELLPFNISRTAATIEQYVKTVKEKFGEKLQSQGIVFDPLESSSLNLSNAAIALQTQLQEMDTNNVLALRRTNDKLMKLERMFLDRNGLPGRPMYKHVVFSPSSKDNYASSVFAGLSDLLFDIDSVLDPASQWVKVKQHFAVLVHTLQAAADFLEQP